MTKPEPKATPSTTRRYLPALLLLFAGSGCAALIYEVVWYQLLQLVIGSTAVSLGVLLATFMGGLCLGSLALPRFLSKKFHPLRVFAAVELGIGICGLLVLVGVPLVGGLYTIAIEHGFPSMILRAVVSAVCLLPPTLLMGASLPAASRWVETNREGVSWMGLLYGFNTAGAVGGCLLAGFYLLRVSDMTTATVTAAAINCTVAGIAYLISRRAPHKVEDAAPEEEASQAGGYWPVYVAIALSGATALGAEVVWTRLLGLMFGATVYTFSIILAVFLVGLGIGSALGSLLLRGRMQPRTALGLCQLLLVGGIAWTAWQIGLSLPYWPVNPFLAKSPWLVFQVDVVRCIWAVLPPALLWGASFPLALAAAAAKGQDPGKLVGRVYAANTGGAIIGALAFSTVLVPWIGTRQSESWLILACLVSSFLILLPLLRRSRGVAGLAALALIGAFAAMLAAKVPGAPPELIAYGRRMLLNQGASQVLYSAEGINSSIAITRWSDGAIQFHVSGKVEASTEPYDMRLQRMLAHLPALAHPNPKSVLIVGFGAGVTAGSFVPHPPVKRIVICEMEPLIPVTAKKYFHKEHFDVLDDSRTKVVFDDARHFVRTTNEKFDIITSDPIHPFVKGSATLYSREYFEMVKSRLNPGGVVTQWVPLYESDRETVKSEIATFFSVFPHGAVFANELNGGGYDVVLMGQVEPLRIDVGAVQARLNDPAYGRVADSLREVGFGNAIQLLASYAGQASDLQPWLQDAAINRDRNLRLQYLAGLALNRDEQNAIYGEMLAYRTYPQNLFQASDTDRDQLMWAIRAGGY